MLSALDVEPDGNLVEVQRLVTVPTEEYVRGRGEGEGERRGEGRRDGGERVNNRI